MFFQIIETRTIKIQFEKRKKWNKNKKKNFPNIFFSHKRGRWTVSEKVNLSVSRWSFKTFYQVMISGALVSTFNSTIDNFINLCWVLWQINSSVKFSQNLCSMKSYIFWFSTNVTRHGFRWLDNHSACLSSHVLL